MKIHSVNVIKIGENEALATYRTDCGQFETIYRNNRLAWAFGALDYMDLLPRKLSDIPTLEIVL